ncbi:MAG: hypothetical protein ABW219_02925 [Ilumatobacteraceae bacterium]
MSDETELPSEPVDGPRRRRGLSIALVVIAAVVMLFTALGTWVKRQALDTDNWVSASSQMLEDPTIRTALSEYLVNELYQAVDVKAELATQLPDQFQGLAGPLAGALREPAARAVDQLLGTSQAQAVWAQVNRTAHTTLTRILEDDTRAGVSTAGGTVTLDVRELIQQLGQELGLPQAALDRIPETAGQVTVIRSDQLDAAQTAVSLVKSLSAILFVVVVAMFVAAVAVADGWRRTALRNVGLAIVIVGLILAVVQRVVGNYIQESVVQQPSNRPSAHAVWYIGTELLRSIARNTIAVGILTILVAVLIGPGRHVTRLRRAVAPTVVERPFVLWGGAAVVLMVVLLWGPLQILETWYGLLIGAAAFAIAVEAFRRQCRQDLETSPPTELPLVATTEGAPV